MKIKKIVKSYDFVISVIISLLVYFIFPCWLNNEMLKDIYGIGISVLSIIFSVYFAALAIIISSSDDSFVRFLENEGFYQEIVFTFEFTLGSLFVALSYSIVIYIATSNWIFLKIEIQPIWCFLFFTFLFSYSLIATGQSALDAIKYAKFRSKYLGIESGISSKESNETE
jgi:hypothetical protein